MLKPSNRLNDCEPISGPFNVANYVCKLRIVTHIRNYEKHMPVGLFAVCVGFDRTDEQTIVFVGKLSISF